MEVIEVYKLGAPKEKISSYFKKRELEKAKIKKAKVIIATKNDRFIICDGTILNGWSYNLYIYYLRRYKMKISDINFYNNYNKEILILDKYPHKYFNHYSLYSEYLKTHTLEEWNNLEVISINIFDDEIVIYLK